MNLADAVEIVRERRQRGAHEEAARLLREYIIQWPESLELQIEDASLAHDKGDVDLEIQKWRMITEGDTKDIPTGVFLRMSAALRRNGSWEEALQALDSPLNLRKDGFETLFQKGLIREQQSDLNEAKRCFERSLEVASTEAQAFQANMRLSLILAKQNKFRKARKLLASTVEIAKATDGNIRTFKRFTAIIDYKEAAAKAPDAWAAYWNERKEYVYLHVCKQILGIVGASARSAADIGSNRTPILDLLPHVPHRFSVDPQNPYVADGIQSVRESFFDWKPPCEINVGSCFQVMEHVSNPKDFAQRMLELCEVSLISVPYREPEGANPGHIQSNIELETICQWFDRMPNYHYIATELSGGSRIICLFDRHHAKPINDLCRNSLSAMDFRYRWSTAGSGLGLGES